MKVRKTLFLAMAFGLSVLSVSVGVRAQTTSNLQPYIVPRGGWRAAEPARIGDTSFWESN